MSVRNDDAIGSELQVRLVERLKFLELDAKSCALIRAVKPLIQRELPKALDAFYDRVRLTPEVRRMFGDEAHIERAKQLQIKYWEPLSEGRFDEQYTQNVLRVGLRHAKIGLSPQWYMGAYGVLFDRLMRAMLEEMWPKSLFASKTAAFKAASETLGALGKAVMLDMELATSVYLDALEIERRKAQAAKAEADEATCTAVGALAKAMEQLAAKSLRHRMSADLAPAFDAIVANVNGALDQLEQAMRVVAAAAETIAGSSHEISDASDNLSQRTEQQAAHLEQTSASLEEVSANIRQTAEGASQARNIVSGAKSNAVRSGAVVAEAVAAMGRIEKSSGEIASIIGVIDEIAFQTNLLALNAGVEAARAGDAGKGFAVVASEVRALAQRSAEAAKDIKRLINAAGGEVEAGVRLVGETGVILNEISSGVGVIDGVITRIAESTREQSNTINEISRAVSELDTMTQQNAAMSEEATASAKSLSQEAARLGRLISEFAVGGKAQSAPAARRPEPRWSRSA